ncbi:hypothetical protein TRFO_06581 [Tritrichomonas foetus]|uniref:Uncharacterized protein n=1 Tax=Tritrichomonas foetus TaxID=1144522 RepID=A0A1J4JX68_9EUKA|nr:hypothetical protein TRFO_06581 [Tritrichomonas foetus]|eukprot:OHT03743.1 hypothetical protein TRFO_06581 [Tritrichomonas foetus]
MLSFKNTIVFKCFNKNMKRKQNNQVTDDAHNAALLPIDGKYSLSDIDSVMHKKLLAPLSALRNQAAIMNDNERKTKIEEIISNLTLFPVKQVLASSDSNNKCYSFPIKKQNQHIKTRVTPEERRDINKVIDAILTDSEIDTIDPSFIPKMIIVLRERNEKALSMGDLRTSRQIMTQIRKLEKMENNVTLSPTSSKRLIANYTQIITNINQIKSEFNQHENSFIEQRKSAEDKMIETNNAEIIAFEEKKESLENGESFNPSVKLRELYQREKKAENYEEKEYFKKEIEKLENEEMFKYIQQVDRLMKIQKERLTKEFQKRKQIFDDHWKAKFEKIKKSFEKKIETEEQQLNIIKKEMENAGIPLPNLPDTSAETNNIITNNESNNPEMSNNTENELHENKLENEHQEIEHKIIEPKLLRIEKDCKFVENQLTEKKVDSNEILTNNKLSEGENSQPTNPKGKICESNTLNQNQETNQLKPQSNKTSENPDSKAINVKNKENKLSKSNKSHTKTVSRIPQGRPISHQNKESEKLAENRKILANQKENQNSKNVVEQPSILLNKVQILKLNEVNDDICETEEPFFTDDDDIDNIIKREIQISRIDDEIFYFQ